MDTQSLVEAGYQLKVKIQDLEFQLKAINNKLAELAEFKDNCKTGHLLTPNIAVTVQLRENVKWLQDRLEKVRGHFPQQFDDLVKIKTEIKPDARKIKALGGEIERAFTWAKEITPGTPQVSYELIEEEVLF